MPRVREANCRCLSGFRQNDTGQPLNLDLIRSPFRNNSLPSLPVRPLKAFLPLANALSEAL